MTGLVLEGGTFRGIFSAGVMDAFLKEGLEFPYIAGVSAGISNAYSYISKQFGRNIEILEKYRGDRRYISLGNFVKNRSYFGLDFVFGEIPHRLVPFDRDAFHSYKGKALVGVTNASDGKTEFLDAARDDPNYTYLRATCAIPGFFPAIELGGNRYYDGGISCPICVKKAFEDGCERAVILLTRPAGYIKKLENGNIAVSRLVKLKYPAMERALLTRHKLYNAQTELCERLERKGKALILRPSGELASFEKDTAKLRAAWQEGFALAAGRMDEIREFCG